MEENRIEEEESKLCRKQKTTAKDTRGQVCLAKIKQVQGKT